jgi:hypothetical protein
MAITTPRAGRVRAALPHEAARPARVSPSVAPSLYARVEPHSFVAEAAEDAVGEEPENRQSDRALVGR